MSNEKKPLPRYHYTCTTSEPDSNAVVVQVVYTNSSEDQDSIGYVQSLVGVFYNPTDAKKSAKVHGGYPWQWTITRHPDDFCYVVYYSRDNWGPCSGRYRSISKIFGEYQAAVTYINKEKKDRILAVSSVYYEIERYRIRGCESGQVTIVKFLSDGTVEQEFSE